MKIPDNKKVNLAEALQNEEKTAPAEKTETDTTLDQESQENKTDEKSEKERENTQEKKKFSLPAWADFGLNIIVIILILTAIRSFIFLPFNVDGPSMEPTLHNKEFIYVDKLMPSFFGYEHGDVIVFYPPSQNGKIKEVDETGFICALDIVKNIALFQGKENPCRVSASFVKRIIGLPGDRVEVKNGSVFVTVKGTDTAIKVGEDFLLDENKKRTCAPVSKCLRKFQLVSEGGKDFGIVPEGKVFVLGDNRRNSSDSRAQGWDTPFVDQENITGIVRAVYLSPKQAAPQDSTLATYWEVIKNIPKSLIGMRWIGDENILGE